MFKKRIINAINNQIKKIAGEVPATIKKDEGESLKSENKCKNTPMVKSSKLIGDITINYDLEIVGAVNGNITSEEKSNIIIKGTCKGSIKTKGGNVNLEGQMQSGDIIAGGDIQINGKFDGSRVTAKKKLYINGEFNGVLEGTDIEIGPSACGKGDLIYLESLSIAKGAKIDVNIHHIQQNACVSAIPQNISDKLTIKANTKINPKINKQLNTEMSHPDQFVPEMPEK